MRLNSIKAALPQRRKFSEFISVRRQEYQQSIEIPEHAAKLNPANSNIQLDLGRAYGMRYDHCEAEKCLEAAARVAPRKHPSQWAWVRGGAHGSVRPQNFTFCALARLCSEVPAGLDGQSAS